MSSLTADLTLADCDSHIVYWQTKRAQATEQRDRQHAEERLNAWLEEWHKISQSKLWRTVYPAR